MSFIRKALLGAATLALSACTQGGLLVANLPTKFDTISVKKDIAYGDKPEQKLDLYWPDQKTATQSPVIVFFHGGRWTDGSKDQYAFVAHSLAHEGFIVVVPDCRKYPSVKFPAFVEDAAAATAWVHDHVKNYGGNPDMIYLSGHSSGAHLAALVTADPKYLKSYRKDRSIIKAFAGLSGPYDFTPDEDDLKDMFGPPEAYPKMQVTTFIDGRQPPILLLHGADDTTVKRRNLDSLEATIRQKGGVVESKIYKGVDHVGTVATFAWFFKREPSVKKDMIEFFRKHTE